MKYLLIIILPLLVYVFIGIPFVSPSLYKQKTCVGIQMMVRARNMITGKEKVFSNPCAVPLGYSVLSSR